MNTYVYKSIQTDIRLWCFVVDMALLLEHVLCPCMFRRHLTCRACRLACNFHLHSARGPTSGD